MNAPGVPSGMSRSIRPGQMLATLPGWLIEQARLARARNKARRDLRHLLEADQRLLDDIGVTRDAVYRELEGL